MSEVCKSNTESTLLRVVIYGLVLFAGYYVGGGFNDSEIKKLSEEYKKQKNSLIQERIQEYDSQLQDLENRIKDLKFSKSKLEKELR